MSFSKRDTGNSLDRPVRLRGLTLLAFVFSVLAILVAMILSNLDRLDRVQSYVSYSHRIQDVGLNLQQSLMDVLSGKPLGAAQLQVVSEKIRALAKEDAHLSGATPHKLRRVIASLGKANSESAESGRDELFEALREMHEILDGETNQREMVLEAIGQDALGELELATLILTLILLLTGLFLRQRILNPLHNLGRLLQNLVKENFTPIATEKLDPLLLPVFNSYNIMVNHLGELEETKRMYAQSLEAEVRLATKALLEQQRSLARAEKLAAVGELAASLAHELRNPLAGIQMTCANLRKEIDDLDQCERLDLVGGELKRMARLLNELLEQGKQQPAQSSYFNLAHLVKQLLTLTRYQIPSNIDLELDIPPGMNCHLPDSELRQALLNLILNAAQALDSNPGVVRIRAMAENDSLLIQVIDNGPGFSEEVLQQGIRTFNTSRIRGTGLGLAMVQRFVRDLGGRIELANGPAGGACVRLMLPGRVCQ